MSLQPDVVVVPEAESISSSATSGAPSSENEGESSSNDNKEQQDVVQAAAAAVEDAQETTTTTTTTTTRKKYKPRIKDSQHKYPVEPRAIHVVHRPKIYVNHSYRDFSCVPPEEGYQEPATIVEMTFAQKVHHMLEDAANNHDMIAWLPHGRAWRVLRPTDFERNVMPTYFGHSRYSNFLSMIRQYGFKSLTHGPDKGCLYHEFMLRGLPHLASYMPVARTPRRLTEDPDNEPDFYSISTLFPLPDRHTINNNSNKSSTVEAAAATTTTPFLFGTTMTAPVHPGGMTLLSAFPQAISHTVTTIGGQTYVIPSVQQAMPLAMPMTTTNPTMLVASPNGTTAQFFLTGGGGGLPTFSFPQQPLLQQQQQQQPGCGAATTTTFLPMTATSTAVGNCIGSGVVAMTTSMPPFVSQPAPEAAADPTQGDNHYL